MTPRYLAQREHTYRPISPSDPWCYHCGAVEDSPIHEPSFDWTVVRDAVVAFLVVFALIVAASGVAR